MPWSSTAIGNITSEMELKKTPKGSDFVQFTVAINNREKTSFVRVAAWGKTAEFASRNFRKGQPVIVSGETSINEWTGKDGTKRVECEIQADRVHFAPFNSGKQDDRPIAQHEVIAMTRDVAPTDVDDKPIDLSEIPFK